MRRLTAGSILLAAAICGLLGLGPSQSHAAGYDVWACANGSGAPLGAGDWQMHVTGPAQSAVHTCGSQNGLVGFLAAEASAGADAGVTGRPGAGWVLAATPGTHISGLDVWWAWTHLPTRAQSAIWVGAQGNVYRGPGTLNPSLAPCGSTQAGCPSTLFIANQGNFGAASYVPQVAYQESNRKAFRNLSPATKLVSLHALCIGFCAQPANQPVARFGAYRVKATVEDATAPKGSSSGLADGMRVAAPRGLQATATDVGGGVHDLSLRIDGRIVRRTPAEGNCADVDPSNGRPYEYNVMKPCPAKLSASLGLAGTDFPDNEAHQLSIVATDAAGRDAVLGSARAARSAPQTFYDAENGFYNPDFDLTRDRRPNGRNAESSAKLTLGFVRGRRTVKKLIARYATRPRIRGRVRTAAGKPVAGARVWRAVQVNGDQWQISGKPLVTSRNGRVSARLPARSPSRKVRLLYFPHTNTNRSAGSASRSLHVQATTTIQADQGGYRNGDTMTLTGQLIRKRLIPGKFVHVQALVRGKWAPAGTTKADARGRWSFRRTFTFTRRSTVYTLRAVVPSQSGGWPWATGYSRRLRVIVTP